MLIFRNEKLCKSKDGKGKNDYCLYKCVWPRKIGILVIQAVLIFQRRWNTNAVGLMKYTIFLKCVVNFEEKMYRQNSHKIAHHELLIILMCILCILF